MTHSMTAFARKTVDSPLGNLSCELRSVNHRYLELAVRLPETLAALEMPLRDHLKNHIARGKVECQIRFQPQESDALQCVINFPLVKALIQGAAEIEQLLPNKAAPINVMDILRWPEVLQTSGKLDLAELQPLLLDLLDQTLIEFTATRQREGLDIQKNFFQRLQSMTNELNLLKQHLPLLQEQQRSRLMTRLADIPGNVESNRVEQEMVIYAQKSDVAEEIERLEAHIVEVRRVLTQGGLVGRRLDFLMQEMNREANTLGSKSFDLETTRASVELKVLIEQMREQVQNVE